MEYLGLKNYVRQMLAISFKKTSKNIKTSVSRDSPCITVLFFMSRESGVIIKRASVKNSYWSRANVWGWGFSSQPPEA